MAERIRIVVADDHPSFRESLIRLLSLDEEIEVVGEAEDGAEAYRLALDLKPDVVVIDLKMPQMDGAEATRRIKAATPETRVVVLSVFSQNDHIRRCLDAGADRYLTKGISREELLAAVKAVAASRMRATERRPKTTSGVCLASGQGGE